MRRKSHKSLETELLEPFLKPNVSLETLNTPGLLSEIGSWKQTL